MSEQDRVSIFDGVMFATVHFATKHSRSPCPRSRFLDYSDWIATLYLSRVNRGD
jgi:hypothetical protein